MHEANNETKKAASQCQAAINLARSVPWVTNQMSVDPSGVREVPIRVNANG